MHYNKKIDFTLARNVRDSMIKKNVNIEDWRGFIVGDELNGYIDNGHKLLLFKDVTVIL